MTKHVPALEFKDAGDADASELVTKALADLTASVDGRLKAIEGKTGDPKLVERLDRMEAKMNRPGKTGGNDVSDLERKAFVSFARRGVERMGADEIKSLTVGTDSAGGYLAPEQFGAELIKLTAEYSPIRQYARVITIGGSEIKYPRRTASTAATWVAETGNRTGSEPAFEQIGITPYELATYTDLSTQLLEDNAYNLEGELLADFAESFGKGEGAAFVKGTGSNQPKGIMSASGIAEIKTGAAATFPTTNPADVIIAMYHKLPTVHAQNGVWTMNRNTLSVMRQWKDGQGRYLIVDPLTAGMVTTLLGRPVVEAIDMDDVGANKYPVLFGDMQGYRIVDRVGLSVLRDPFTLAAQGQVRIHARKRVGADLTHPDRFIKLKCSA